MRARSCGKFASKAFRRPVDERTLDRLTTIARATYQQPGKTVEQGVGQAMVVVLASPRFLFRVEGAEPVAAGKADRPARRVQPGVAAFVLSLVHDAGRRTDEARRTG